MQPEYFPTLEDQTPPRPGTPVKEPTPNTAPTTLTIDVQLVNTLLQTVGQQSEQLREVSAYLVNSNASSIIKGPKYPDVPLYDGKVKDFSNFLASVELFFMNMPSFATDTQRIGYVLTRLSGTARDWATTLIQRREIPENARALSDWNEFLRLFKRFDEPNSVSRNNAILLNLKQGERESVNSYYTRFCLAMNRSKYAENPEFARPIFFCGLKPSLRRVLAVETNNLDLLPFEEYVLRVIAMDQKLYDADSRAPFRSSTPQTHIKGPAPMEIDLNHVKIAEEGFGDNSVERLREIRADPNWRDICRLEKRCFYCKCTGHSSVNCNVKANRSNSTYSSVDELRLNFSTGLATLDVSVQGVHLESVLIDCGAGGTAFIDAEQAKNLGLKFLSLKDAVRVTTVDGSAVGSRLVAKYVKVPLTVGNLCMTVDAYVLHNLKFNFILGLGWLRLVNPQIDWVTGKLTLPTIKPFQEPDEYLYVTTSVSTCDRIMQLNAVQVLPTWLQDYGEVVDTARAKSLPEYNPRFAMGIKLKSGKEPHSVDLIVCQVLKRMH